MNTYRVWQVKRDGQVTGPFPEPQILQYILIGRISVSDLVSMDGNFWQSYEHTPELIEQIRHLGGDGGDSQWQEERLRAIFRNADERKRPDPRGHEPPETSAKWTTRTGVDRRKKPETVRQHAYRETISEVDHWLSNHRPGRSVTAVLLAGLAILTGLSLHFFGSEAPRVDLGLRPANCDAQPVGRVDWHGCDKAGYVLAGADLHEANLIGARFAGANLSYANLKQARVDGAVFDGAKLAGATWVDGRVCAAGSVGSCR